MKHESSEILELEFEYALETSMQAQKDRLTLIKFYVTLFVGFITVTFSFQDSFSEGTTQVIPYLFLVLSFIAVLFILQLVRLRQAWIDSLKTMNKIKEIYFLEHKDLKNFFRWTMKTIPSPEQMRSLNAFSALILSLLGAISCFFGILFITYNIFIALFISILFLCFTLLLYYVFLKNNL